MKTKTKEARIRTPQLWTVTRPGYQYGSIWLRINNKDAICLVAPKNWGNPYKFGSKLNSITVSWGDSIRINRRNIIIKLKNEK